jgi:hypothetical protein
MTDEEQGGGVIIWKYIRWKVALEIDLPIDVIGSFLVVLR